METINTQNAIKIERKDLREYRDILMECHIPEKNTHKYYHFHIPEADSPSFTIQYGRVGKKPNNLSYMIDDLYQKFSEKLRKGYQVIRVSRFDERSITFVDFVEKWLGDLDEDILPE